MALLLSSCSAHPVTDLFLTPDQQGRWFWERGDYTEAAARFDDSMWRGTALYAAGDLEGAIAEFSRLDTAEAWFARGNALTHLERYPEAVAAYARSVELDPGWREALENRDYVELFIPYEPEGGGGDMGAVGDVARPDEIRFDADQDRLASEGKDTEMQESVLSEEQLTDMWLRQVETSPTQFLGHKFAYQVAVEDGGGE